MSLNDSKRVLLRQMLIEKRKNANFTQVQLAKELNKPQSFVSKYESGERKLDAVELIEVIQALSSEPVEFIKEYIHKLG